MVPMLLLGTNFPSIVQGGRVAGGDFVPLRRRVHGQQDDAYRTTRDQPV